MRRILGILSKRSLIGGIYLSTLLTIQGLFGAQFHPDLKYDSYRRIGGDEIKIISKTELELRVAEGNFVCPYSVRDKQLRYVVSLLGQQEALYLTITDEGLRDKDGNTYLGPSAYDRVMKRQWAMFESSRTYRGTLKTATLLVFDDGKKYPFQIRFISTDRSTGKVSAALRGTDDKQDQLMEGTFKGLHLNMKNSSGTEWNLVFQDGSDGPKFVGSHSAGIGGISSGTVEILLGTSANDAMPSVSSARALNGVCPKAHVGEFRHGTKCVGYYDSNGKLMDIQVVGKPPSAKYPSARGLVHAGVDLVANESSELFPIADGTVADLIGDVNDPDFYSLGYMVLVHHRSNLDGKPTYSIYLHLKEKPPVNIGGSVTAGKTLLGYVGQTGAAFGPHLHIEIRHFGERFFGKWKNIYGIRQPPSRATFNETEFQENWIDPETFGH